MTFFKWLLTLTTAMDWHLLQFDVHNAFLNGILAEDVYMKLPPRYTSYYPSDIVYKLNKSIYGLKQASRPTFSSIVLKFGFKQSVGEPTLFTKGIGKNLITLFVCG